ncbi:MAG: NapC/NirT family cytochrome c [Planctomycetota bacterium]
MARLLLLLRSNWISAFGAILTTLSFMGFAITWIYLTLHGAGHGPYMGMFAFVLLPVLFVFGLVIIPVGLWVYRKQLTQRMEMLMNKPFRLLRFVGLLTLINLAVAGTGGYEAMKYMDSPQFCGTLCHEVMSPTFDVYVDSPHARVECVECHIGRGATSFVKAKMSGLRRVFAVMFDTSRRPIPAPVHDMAPASDTCEHCHWSDRFIGDRLVVRKHYQEDEAVTPMTSVLLMKVGGIHPDGTATGNHWHNDPANAVSYIADETRTKISWVKYKTKEGKERVFTVEGVDAKKPPEGEVRTMDCIDCHNQPSHRFQDPGDAIDGKIASGLISRQLPFIRKVGLEALQQTWTRANVRDGIRAHLEKFYGDKTLPAEGKDLIGKASDMLAEIWTRNVHPEMNITWGTYKNFIGHDGCMRCHDGEHFDDDGEMINADCALCHQTLAKQESNPDVLKRFGIDGR